MKITVEQLQTSFARLSAENLSVRTLAKELKINKSTLIRRFQATYGYDYIALSRGLNFSLLKSLKKDILPKLLESEQLTVRQWMQNNLHHLTAPADIYTVLSDNETDR